MDSPAKYKALTVAALKEELLKRDLDVSGKKPELVKRLADHDKEHSQEDETVQQITEALGDDDDGAECSDVELNEIDEDEIMNDDDGNVEIVHDEDIEEGDADKLDDTGAKAIDESTKGGDSEKTIDQDASVKENGTSEEESAAEVKEESKTTPMKTAQTVEAGEAKTEAVEEVEKEDNKDESKAEAANEPEKESDDEDEDAMLPYEDLQKKLGDLYKSNIKKARYMENHLRMIKVYGLTVKDLFHGAVVRELRNAKYFVFSYFKSEEGKNTGIAEICYGSMEAAAEAAKAFREFSQNLKGGDIKKRFQVKTFYGTYEKSLEEKKKKQEEAKKKREEDLKAKKEKYLAEKAEREIKAAEEKEKQAELQKEKEKEKAELDSRSIYISNLPATATKDMLSAICSEAVKISMPLDNTGKCKGHAYLEFTTTEEKDTSYAKYQEITIDDGKTARKLELHLLPLSEEMRKKVAQAQREENKKNQESKRNTQKRGGFAGRKSDSFRGRGRDRGNMRMQTRAGRGSLLGRPQPLLGSMRPLVGGGGNRFNRGIRDIQDLRDLAALDGGIVSNQLQQLAGGQQHGNQMTILNQAMNRVASQGPESGELQNLLSRVNDVLNRPQIGMGGGFGGRAGALLGESPGLFRDDYGRGGMKRYSDEAMYGTASKRFYTGAMGNPSRRYNGGGSRGGGRRY